MQLNSLKDCNLHGLWIFITKSLYQAAEALEVAHTIPMALVRIRETTLANTIIDQDLMVLDHLDMFIRQAPTVETVESEVRIKLV